MTGGHTLKTTSTRERILDAAIELFLENGFHTTNIDSVAARSRSSKQTIYKYYEGKEEILQHALTRLIEEFQNEIQSINSDAADLRNELADFGERYINTLLTDRHIKAFRLCVETAHKSSRMTGTAGPVDMFGLQDSLRDFFAQSARRGQISESANTEFLAKAFMGMLHGNYLSLRALNVGTTPTTDELKDHVAKVTELICDSVAVSPESRQQA